jgi:quercetin dioxygenase-like cupin family protein
MSRSKLTFLAGIVVGAVMATAITGVADSRVRASAAGAAAGLVGQGTAKAAVKVVLENDRVRVRDVTFPPGVLDTGMHTHELAHVGIILTDGTLRFTEPDGKKEDASFTSGTVGFRGANATHMVANPGKSVMRVIEVELK